MLNISRYTELLHFLLRTSSLHLAVFHFIIVSPIHKLCKHFLRVVQTFVHDIQYSGIVCVLNHRYIV